MSSLENVAPTKGNYMNVFKFLCKICLHKHTVWSQNKHIFFGSLLNKDSDICQILYYGLGCAVSAEGLS